jgi:phospholipase/carboxylesterase
MCTAEESKELYDLLEKAGANVHISWSQQGHQLTLQEVKEAAKWYEES